MYEGGKSNSYLLTIKIKHRSFPFLCIGENHGTVLELNITYVEHIVNIWKMLVNKSMVSGL